MTSKIHLGCIAQTFLTEAEVETRRPKSHQRQVAKISKSSNIETGEKIRIDFNKMLNKNWKNTVEKFIEHLQPMSYYKPLPLKAGPEFFRLFVENTQFLKNAQINIPQTIGLFNDKFYMRTSVEEDGKQGHITVTSIFKEESICEELASIAKNVYKKKISEDMPAMIFKREGYNEISDWTNFKYDLSGRKLDFNCIAQQYLYPFGGKACCVRFIYYNPACNLDNNQSFSMNVANKLKIDEKEKNKEYSLQSRCTFVKENRNSYDLYITNKGGPKQREYERIAEIIIQMVMKVYKIRITKLVLDFIQDQERVHYLVAIPSFEVDKYIRFLHPDTSLFTKPKLTSKQIFEDKSALVYCKLCKVAFMKNEVSKIVTMKMISELRGHYNKRGIFKFDHFTKFKDTKRTCKVCELCYMIVIAEHELMKIEHQFAIYQGIPVHEENNPKHSKAHHRTNMVRPEDIQGKLKQWRILFYLDSLRDVNIPKLMKHKQDDDSLYIQIKLFDYFTKFKMNVKNPLQDLEQDNSSSVSEENSDIVNKKGFNLRLNKLRVHYFFTEFYQINKLLEETKLEIRITSGEDWSKVLAVGAIAPFYDMNPDKYEMVQTEYLRVPFLSQHVPEFYLTMKSGLKYDKDILVGKTNEDTSENLPGNENSNQKDVKEEEKLTLYQFNDVLFPENHYYNSDSLPIEWMEIFETKETLKELEQDSMISNMFTQSVDKDQIDKTEEPRSFLNRTILKAKYQRKKAADIAKAAGRNFIKENITASTVMKPTSSEKETSKKRPATAFSNAKKFSRFFSSRNRPDFLFETSNMGFMSHRNDVSKDPWEEVKLGFNSSSDALRITGSHRPVSAFEQFNKTNKTRLLLNHKIPEKLQQKICKRKKRRRRFKKKSKPFLWQYLEDQTKTMAGSSFIRPTSARNMFRNNLAKKKSLKQLFDLVSGQKKASRSRVVSARPHKFNQDMERSSSNVM
ncbi:unnamed protein product [Moneuplotes crassus]|uniref:Uncharacterized protein n=1 Tax=Euplotes crassus TaxID=5936 RepID=A0AAD1XVJ2_EUPCR|nr:unnamed protein product [Moneuplotes crassus]